MLILICMMVMLVAEAQEGAPGQGQPDPFCWFTCMRPCVEGRQHIVSCFFQCLPKCGQAGPPPDRIDGHHEVQN